VLTVATEAAFAAGPARAKFRVVGACTCSWEFEAASDAARDAHASAITPCARRDNAPAWGYVHYRARDVWRLGDPAPLPEALASDVLGPALPYRLFAEFGNQYTAPGGNTVTDRLHAMDTDTSKHLMVFNKIPLATMLGQPEPVLLRSVKLSMRTENKEDLVPGCPSKSSITRWKHEHGAKRARSAAVARPAAPKVSWEGTLLELPRKRRRTEVGGGSGAGAVATKKHRDPITMIKAVLFARFLKQTKDFDKALDAAKGYENPDIEVEPRPASEKNARVLLDRARARLNVVETLLERREFHADRVHDQIVAINLFSDASPNCGLEFQGMICDVWKRDLSCRRVVLPGSSLSYGLADGISKGIALLWSIWVLCGPLHADVIYFCERVTSITTDGGIEVTTLTLPNILPAFFKWLQGEDLGSCLEDVRHDERLFPNGLRIIGWSHTWGNIMKTVAHSTPRWPELEQRMRDQVKFWKNTSWRNHVQKCVKRTAPEVDTTALDHFSVDMAKWRYQTIAEVTKCLDRVRAVAEHHVVEEWFSNTQERQIIHDFIQGCRDPFFWKFVSCGERHVWSTAERERHWGMICSCKRHLEMRAEGVKHISCVHNSRRLETAGDQVKIIADNARQSARDLREEHCEGDNDLFRMIRTMLQKLASTTTQRLKYLRVTPWSFSCTRSVAGAKSWIDEVLARPLEEHDALTRTLWRNLETQVRSRADGNDIQDLHEQAVVRMNLSPLGEDPGESYHSVTTHEKTRAPSSSTAHLKQEARAFGAFEHVIAFRKRYGPTADEVLRHEWRNWKRALQTKPSRRWQPVRMNDRAFFKRMYREDDKASEDWGTIAKRLPSARPVVAEDAGYRQQLENEFVRAQMQPGHHYSLPRVEEQIGETGQAASVEAPMFFEVLGIQHSHSRLHEMETVNSADDISLTAPLAVEIQPAQRYEHAVEDGATAVTVFPEGEPMWVEPRHLGDFARWSQKLLVYRDVSSSSAPGCLALDSPERARPPFGVLDDRCPTLAVIAHNRAHGWISVQHRVTHTTTAIGECDSAEAIKWKGYHQCLAIIQRTLPLTSTMPSRELVGYYKLLLRGVAVEPGLPNKDYIVMLNKNKRKRNEELEPIPLEDGVVEGNDDGVMVVGPPQHPVPTAKRHPAPPGRRRQDSHPGSSGDQLRPIVNVVCPGAGPEGGPSGPGGGNDDGVVGVPDEADDGIIGAPAAGAAGIAGDVVKSQWVDALDGCQVNYRDYKNRKTGKQYINWKLRCPNPDHGAECIKTKGDLPKLLELYGPIGPLAFLHAWSATPPKEGATHINTEPSAPSVKAYAAAHKDELQQEAVRAQAASSEG